MLKARLAALVTGIAVLVLAFGIRAVDDGELRQYSGTALYASLIYAIVVFVRPRADPILAGLIAVGFCWAVELSQLTGLPAELSARSAVSRFVLGSTFDVVDLAWYPAGVVPLVLLHQWVHRQNERRGMRHRSEGQGVRRRDERPPANRQSE